MLVVVVIGIAYFVSTLVIASVSRSLCWRFRVGLTERSPFCFTRGCPTYTDRGCQTYTVPFSLTKDQRSKRYTILSVLAVHQPFYISICLSTLPTQHTTFSTQMRMSSFWFCFSYPLYLHRITFRSHSIFYTRVGIAKTIEHQYINIQKLQSKSITSYWLSHFIIWPRLLPVKSRTVIGCLRGEISP